MFYEIYEDGHANGHGVHLIAVAAAAVVEEAAS